MGLNCSNGIILGSYIILYELVIILITIYIILILGSYVIEQRRNGDSLCGSEHYTDSGIEKVTGPPPFVYINCARFFLEFRTSFHKLCPIGKSKKILEIFHQLCKIGHNYWKVVRNFRKSFFFYFLHLSFFL